MVGVFEGKGGTARGCFHSWAVLATLDELGVSFLQCNICGSCHVSKRILHRLAWPSCRHRNHNTPTPTCTKSVHRRAPPVCPCSSPVPPPSHQGQISHSHCPQQSDTAGGHSTAQHSTARQLSRTQHRQMDTTIQHMSQWDGQPGTACLLVRNMHLP
jgi:hypothetical protein